MREKHQPPVVMYGLIIVLAAQVNMNLFISNFKISTGIIMFSVLLLLAGKYPVIPVTLFSAAGVYASRIAVDWFRQGTIGSSAVDNFPEMVFYLTYGVLFFLYCLKHNYDWGDFHIPVFFFFDYAANLVELALRLGAGAFTWKHQLSILLVAVLRTASIWCIYLVLRYYKFSLLRREHAQRYQRLLLLISKLNGEVLWMKKNTRLIEDTMNTSYHLYQEMQKERPDSELSRQALSVAKDIHEIKKEYLLILRGLSEALDLNLDDEGMHLKDIFTVLENSLNTAPTPGGRTLCLDLSLEEDLYTEDHYFLMSIFRNLITNAMEAAEHEIVHVRITQRLDDSHWLFTVTDDGPGILKEDLEDIFQPGFSTKINYDTGEINRGLGLNLVQDIIKNQWNGQISVSSHPGETVFSIQIPKSQLKGAR
ncbi:sensor histidine kinase [Faecalicatena faecalis]|uniref:sensor histidine kinase n=1 Tax=Faecalicatena faecalis TaxID=2726362 RepID=UPI001FE7F8A8|nr:sensor histidine kinase [Faecalicatena faecalis]